MAQRQPPLHIPCHRLPACSLLPSPSARIHSTLQQRAARESGLSAPCPAGCKIPATWFVSINYTDPNLVQEVYMKNHEIATHTFSHVMNPGGLAGWEGRGPRAHMEGLAHGGPAHGRPACAGMLLVKRERRVWPAEEARAHYSTAT